MERVSQSPSREIARKDEERTSRTVCGICSGTCGMTLQWKNGVVSSVEGDMDHPVSRGHLCPKGRALPELMRAQDRLKHPLRKMPSGEWKQVSWEEAYRFLTGRLQEIRQLHGPEAMAIHVGQAGVGKEFLSYAERFSNLYGTPNFSTSGSHCYESKWMANMATYGAMPIAHYEESGCIVLWGKNPLSSTPSVVESIREAHQRGAALLVIDPRRTMLGEKATLHLQPRPGTDGALALGLIHVIIKEKLYDEEFVREWTLGFDRLVEHVSAYTPDKVERITRVPAAKIEEAARLYALSESACVSPGVALELNTNGFQTIRAITILQAITGNLDVAGGSIFLKEARLTELKLIRKGTALPAIGADEHPFFHRATGHAQANLYAGAILEGKPYPLRGLLVAGSNPVLTWPNADRVREALGKLEFLAVIDPFMTETAKLADLVLPCATFLGNTELWDSSHLSSEPRLGVSWKLCDEEGLPTNWDIWKEITTRMGYGNSFPWETEEDAIDHRLRSLDLTLEDLKREPEGRVYHRWTPRKFMEDGFRTVSGKVEIYSPELERSGYDGLPTYHEPAESPESTPDVAVRYPLVLTTGARTLG